MTEEDTIIALKRTSESEFLQSVQNWIDNAADTRRWAVVLNEHGWTSEQWQIFKKIHNVRL